MPSHSTKPTRDKPQPKRERSHKPGLQPAEMRLPDTRDPAFRAEARRQALAVATSEGEKDDLAFIDSLYDFGEE